MKKIVALLAMTVLSGQAFAADAIVSAPEPAPVEYSAFSWTGGYIGAHAGYGWGNTQDVYNSVNSPKKKMKGGFGGIQAGYNWQFDNNVVLGAEADVSFGKIKKNWSDMADGTNTWSSNSTYYTEDKIGTHGTVRARLGYAADRFLPYVTGGLAWADTKSTLGCSGVKPIAAGKCVTPDMQFETSKSKVRVGYAVGAGLEYAVTDNWTVKAEYLYSNFGKKNVTLVDPNPNTESTRRFKTDLSEVRIGVNYKF
ncbi:porin family protein [Ochrobactrum sp. MR28]|nr:porin family protein [Ochrobactrum sp. MR28]MBX8817779.1 porin family protein [Ochrobactrum sp. MR31]